MKVYKGTDKDMRCCGGFQYELGKTVEDDGAIRCGNKGFHSCVAPFDVLRYFHKSDGARFFVAEADGVIDESCKKGKDSKIASSKLTLKAEIGFADLVNAQIEYTKEKAKTGISGGDYSNLAGDDGSNLAGGEGSNLAGGDYSNLAGGDYSNLAGGDGSNLAGGDYSNLAGGVGSNLAGGYYSNLAGGDYSNLAGGDGSNLAGGYYSNLAGGDYSNLAGGVGSNLSGGKSALLSCRDGRAKGGLNSVIVLTHLGWVDGFCTPVAVKAEIVDGERIRADTWYELQDGEFVEVEDHE